jgi:LytR cell envelope-related transcriptional attenuator
VDHPLPAPDALIRPWRTAAYVAVAVAAVELLLLLAIGGGKIAGLLSDRMQVAARERVLPTATQVVPNAGKVKRAHVKATARARSKTVVMVLNGNGRTGAAAGAAERVRSRGYPLGTVGNASKQAPRTIAMFRPGFAAEGRRLGHDLGVRLVGPLDGMRPHDLGRAQVVLILGS